MDEIKMYLDTEFKKLPYTRFYRELKKNILMDCEDKYDGYYQQYRKKTNEIIKEEIEGHKELYQGDYYLFEWFNIIINIGLIAFLIYTTLLSSEAKALAQATFNIQSKLNHLSVYYILLFPILNAWIIISYSITNFIFIGLKARIKKYPYLKI